MDWAQFLAALKVQDVALAGIVTFIIFRILTGKLSPESVTNDLKAERDAWKQAYVTSEEAGHVKDSQIAELLELSRTATHALRSLPGVGGDANVVQEDTQPPLSRR